MGLYLTNIKQNKTKKSFTDFVSLFFALAVIFGVAIFAVILYTAYNDHIEPKFNEAITSSTDVDPNANVTKVLEQTGGGVSRLNVLFPFLLIGVFGFVLVSALMARSHPAFLFIGLIVLGIALILGAIFSNVYQNLAETDEYSDTNEEFGVIGIFLDNLPTVILILFVAIALILYAFPARPPGGGY